MKRIGAVLATVVLSLWIVVAAPPSAHAAGAPITRMDIVMSVATDGTINVTQTMDMNFTTPGHGPYLYFTTRKATGNGNQYVVYTYHFTSVTSPTNAPSAFITENPSYGTTVLRIGNANQTVTGLQTYTISYTLKGAINPKVAASNLDELYWNVIGTGFVVPISNVSVRLTSATPIVKTTCWTGANFDKACTGNSSSGSSATYTQSSLSTGQGFAVVAGWPAGTFPDVTPTYENHSGGTGSGPATSWTSPWVWGTTGVAGVAAVGGLVFASRRGRDEMFKGLAPGSIPSQGEPFETERVSKIPFAVQFTPPKGAPVGMIGTLFDEKADVRDVTATMVDLAARGYWRIEQPNPGKEFQLVRLAPPHGLNGYERMMYTAFFGDGSSVVTSRELESKSFGGDVQSMQREMYRAVTQVGWFKGNPETARSMRAGGGTVLAAAGIFLGVMSSSFIIPIPFVLVGGALLISSGMAPVRTALGSAVTSQALGFKQYLETAEADQIKWEEGQDIFSRYLPYAIAFGCADRWAKLFADMAARGMPVQPPTWYVGPYGYGYGAAWGAGGFDSIIGTLNGFSASTASAQTAASAGSSGGSGFSGGGFGGGGGGGGGGSW